MKTRFTYWQDSDGLHLGFLNEYPDHWTAVRVHGIAHPRLWIAHNGVKRHEVYLIDAPQAVIGFRFHRCRDVACNVSTTMKTM